MQYFLLNSMSTCKKTMCLVLSARKPTTELYYFPLIYLQRRWLYKLFISLEILYLSASGKVKYQLSSDSIPNIISCATGRSKWLVDHVLFLSTLLAPCLLIRCFNGFNYHPFSKLRKSKLILGSEGDEGWTLFSNLEISLMHWVSGTHGLSCFPSTC